MLAETGLEQGKNTLNALHFNPTSTGQINRAGGQFIIPLKENQPRLFEQMLIVLTCSKLFLSNMDFYEKAVGRRGSPGGIRAGNQRYVGAGKLGTQAALGLLVNSTEETRRARTCPRCFQARLKSSRPRA
jgi:hypothetical protein